MDVVRTQTPIYCEPGATVQVNEDPDVYMICQDLMGTELTKIVSLSTGKICPWPLDPAPVVKHVHGKFMEDEQGDP